MKNIIYSILLLTLFSCNGQGNQIKEKTNLALKDSTQQFLDSYNKTYQELITASNEALWHSYTRIIENDTATKNRVNSTAEKLAAFAGSDNVINSAKYFLNKKQVLSDLQVLQLKQIIRIAAQNPQAMKKEVNDIITCQTSQNDKYYKYDYIVDGKPWSEVALDSMLLNEERLNRRQEIWEASKDLGIGLKSGLAKLRNLRNKTVQRLGYDDYFDYQVSDYDMSTDEMITLLNQINKELRPLYKEIHTYIRYELTKKYNVNEVPDLIPSHWLPEKFGQDWSSLVALKEINLDSILKSKKPSWILEQTQDLFSSIGFEKLPVTYWEKSDFYPLPPNTDYKKNFTTSSWHINLDDDIRSLVSIEPTSYWYQFMHIEFTHMYNYMAYSNPSVPMVLRRQGIDRAYSESMAELMSMAALKKAYLSHIGVVKNKKEDEEERMKMLLKEALNTVVFIPFSAGTVSMFEHKIYSENLPEDKFNTTWWELTATYQGIAPPSKRGEDYCDAVTKMHVNSYPAEYYDYPISTILMYQLNEHISNEILHQDPRNPNYYGNKKVGAFLYEMMEKGGGKNWKEALKNKLGSEMSAKAMVNYFEPLRKYLKKINKGRTYTLPDFS